MFRIIAQRFQPIDSLEIIAGVVFEAHFENWEAPMMQMLRRAVLPLLKWTAIDVGISHPWIPKQRIVLNSFRHKGYWFHGKAREKTSMELFAKLIAADSRVIEVGGHIGFISQYFSHLVGREGKVFVFEPGSNNLPYIRRNIAKLKNISLERRTFSLSRI